MLLLQARQLLPQLAFFLFGHRHRRFAFPRGGRVPPTIESVCNYPVFHKPVQGWKKPSSIKGFRFHLLGPVAGCTVALVSRLR